jgi:hypothetical protein
MLQLVPGIFVEMMAGFAKFLLEILFKINFCSHIPGFFVEMIASFAMFLWAGPPSVCAHPKN